ncbi:hypothetical protein LMB72_01435, partial [Limosilactobacillus reuteri]|nr:hypothetical protein [Limosilactobacillus reuteri]
MFDSITSKGTSLTNADLEDFSESVLNSALKVEESSITHAFSVKFDLKSGTFDFIPQLPVSFSIDGNLAQKIQQIMAGALYPVLTLLPMNGPVFTRENSSRLSSMRGLRFYFKLGIAKRLFYHKLSDIKAVKKGNSWHIPLMAGYDYVLNTSSAPHFGIEGKSGAGKTVLELSLIQGIWSIPNSHLVICDPKLDLHLYQFANSHERVNYLTPAVNDNPSVFF